MNSVTGALYAGQYHDRWASHSEMPIRIVQSARKEAAVNISNDSPHHFFDHTAPVLSQAATGSELLFPISAEGAETQPEHAAARDCFVFVLLADGALT
jgi:hypothetical protein